jgi:hypothetical protein
MPLFLHSAVKKKQLNIASGCATARTELLIIALDGNRTPAVRTTAASLNMSFNDTVSC